MKSEGIFRAIEFEADVCDGMIHIPSEYRHLFREGERVRIVILYADSRVPDGVKSELESNIVIQVLNHRHSRNLVSGIYP